MKSNVQKIDSIEDAIKDCRNTSHICSSANIAETQQVFIKMLAKSIKDFEKSYRTISNINVTPYKDKVYHVKYKDQLQSIEFIMDVQEIKTTKIIANSENDAAFKVRERFGPKVVILKIEFLHDKIDNTSINLNFHLKIKNIEHIIISAVV